MPGASVRDAAPCGPVLGPGAWGLGASVLGQGFTVAGAPIRWPLSRHDFGFTLRQFNHCARAFNLDGLGMFAPDIGFGVGNAGRGSPSRAADCSGIVMCVSSNACEASSLNKQLHTG